MLDVAKKQRIRNTLEHLLVSIDIAGSRSRETVDLLIDLLQLDTDDSVGKTSRRKALADHRTFSVVWGDRTCFLGHTLLFRLFERLARSPNQYIAHIDLLDDVWQGERRSSSIRGVLKRLRDRLKSAGMSELAAAIDSSVSGYYRLNRV